MLARARRGPHNGKRGRDCRRRSPRRMRGSHGAGAVVRTGQRRRLRARALYAATAARRDRPSAACFAEGARVGRRLVAVGRRSLSLGARLVGGSSAGREASAMGDRPPSRRWAAVLRAIELARCFRKHDRSAHAPGPCQHEAGRAGGRGGDHPARWGPDRPGRVTTTLVYLDRGRESERREEGAARAR